MEPDTVFAADARNFWNGIDGVGGGRTDRCADETRHESVSFVLRDLSGKLVGPHVEAFVNCDRTQVCGSEARDLRGFLDRGMRLRGTVGDEFTVGSLRVAAVICGAFASRQK